jgi:cell division protein FtsB
MNIQINSGFDKSMSYSEYIAEKAFRIYGVIKMEEITKNRNQKIDEILK